GGPRLDGHRPLRVGRCGVRADRGPLRPDRRQGHRPARRLTCCRPAGPVAQSSLYHGWKCQTECCLTLGMEESMGGGSRPTGPKFTAKQVTRPRAQVEQQIREAILGGLFSPGEKLPPETQLAEQFGVSRPTVREALGSLVTAGLIRKVPGVAGGSF